MTALDEFRERGRFNLGVTELDGYDPDPLDIAFDGEVPVAGTVIHGDQGAIGVLFYMPHEHGGELGIEVQAFDAEGGERLARLRSSGNGVKVT